MTRSTRYRTTGWLALALGAAGCSGGNESSLGDELASLPQDTMPADSVVNMEVPPAPIGLADTIGFPGAEPPTAPPAAAQAPEAGADTTRPTPALPPRPRALDTRPWIPANPDTLVLPPAEPAREWTAGRVAQRRPGVRMTTQSGVRAARNDGFDRVVLEFAGDRLPGYRVEYVDRPVRQCGSGDPVPVAGQGWLSIRLDPAQAHDDRGRATVRDRALRPDLPVIEELRMICDFEGQVEWVLGVGAPNRYRVLELSDPARLVIDVRH